MDPCTKKLGMQLELYRNNVYQGVELLLLVPMLFLLAIPKCLLIFKENFYYTSVLCEDTTSVPCATWSLRKCRQRYFSAAFAGIPLYAVPLVRRFLAVVTAGNIARAETHLEDNALGLSSCLSAKDLPGEARTVTGDCLSRVAPSLQPC